MRGRRAFLLAALVLAGAGAAPADRLVTRDGDVIETRGPWEVRGRLVVFKLADGTLASLRLEEADLEASEELAREAERRARATSERRLAPPPPPPRAVTVLTDNDVGHVRGVGAPGGEGESGEEGGGEAAGTPAAGGGVQVVQWNQESGGETGVLIKGVAQNLGNSIATRVAVDALFYDETGGLLLAREVTLEQGALSPGARREFSVAVPHELVFDEIKFQVTGRGFRSVGQRVRVGPPPEPDGEPRQEPLEEPQTP